jgi:hypothetical protein
MLFGTSISRKDFCGCIAVSYFRLRCPNIVANRDLPGIIEGAADGRGRGRQVISTARTCNLILIVLDAAKPVTHKKIIEHELFSFGIRINQEVRKKSVVASLIANDLFRFLVSFSALMLLVLCFWRVQPPEVKFIKKESGGIGYQETVKQTKGMDAEVARLICKEYRISCAEIILREDITVDQVRPPLAFVGTLVWQSDALTRRVLLTPTADWRHRRRSRLHSRYAAVIVS